MGSSHGYHERVFEITNSSPVRTHEVRLVVSNGRISTSSHHLQQISNSVLVGPSGTARLALLQPPLLMNGAHVRAVVDGFRAEGQLDFDSAHPNATETVEIPSGSGTKTEPALKVLVSQRVRIDAFPQTPDPARYLRATVPVSEWSENWLAYSGYDGIVLEAGDLEEGASLAASAATRKALRRYVDVGGSLLVVGSSPHQGSGFTVSHSGLGETLTSTSSVSEFEPEQIDRLVESWTLSREPWVLARDPTAAHRIFKVAADIEIPVRGLFLVVVAFTLLIGPINLLVLSRLKKRIWMLWTVPAFALLASVLVFLYALFSEGLLRIERGASLTMLDERGREASTVGWLGYYSTLTPGDGLRFSRQTEVSPILRWTWGSGPMRRLNWREDQHFVTGFVNARLPAYFLVRKSEMRRERLGVRRGVDGSVEVTNGLGAPIEALYLADLEGRVHRSTRLEAGASGGLELDPDRAMGNPASPRTLYQSEFPKQLNKIIDRPHAYLQPGTYVAILKGSPFMDEALKGVRESDQRTVVYGFMGEGGFMEAPP